MIEGFNNKITAVAVVYNEINRIESTLKCFLWCDEIVVIDRNSTDGTRDIISKYTQNLVTIYNRDLDPVNDNITWYNNVNTEWVICFSASDIIHPLLAIEIKKLVENDNGEFDIIEIPFNRYILGLNPSYSPWHEKNSKITVFRKSAYKFNSESVHNANVINSNRVYVLKLKNLNHAFLHLTHPSMDHMMDRHLNYIRTEAKIYKGETLSKPLFDVFKAIYHISIRRKTVFNGYDGLALAFSYLAYYMLSFVYKWERNRGSGQLIYKQMREDIMREWEKHNARKNF